MASFNLGQKGEALALNYLRNKGLTLRCQNYRCFLGEIDLILQDGDDIVFVEVKLRLGLKYGNGLESINWNKRLKLIKTAVHYLQQNQSLYEVNSRFDIMLIHPVKQAFTLEWIKNAFTADSL